MHSLCTHIVRGKPTYMLTKGVAVGMACRFVGDIGRWARDAGLTTQAYTANAWQALLDIDFVYSVQSPAIDLLRSSAI